MKGLNDLQYDNSLLDSYKPADIDEASDPKYFGFITINGQWYILRVNESAGTLRYARGDGDYSTNWTNRASLTYDYLYNVFS